MNKLFFVFLTMCISLAYCTNEEIIPQNSTELQSTEFTEILQPYTTLSAEEIEELEQSNFKDDGPKACCEGSSLTKELISVDQGSVGKCCRYRFTFVKGETRKDCKFSLGRGAMVDGPVIESATTITWESEICIDSNGGCTSSRILVIAENDQRGYICATDRISTDCPCPYTYTQGLQVGAGLANQVDCNENAGPYVNTIRDFSCMCSNYVNGVIAGFEDACDGCDDVPQGCVCIDGHIDCQ